jgi:hypothetical protein
VDIAETKRVKNLEKRVAASENLDESTEGSRDQNQNLLKRV